MARNALRLVTERTDEVVVAIDAAPRTAPANTESAVDTLATVSRLDLGRSPSDPDDAA